MTDLDRVFREATEHVAPPDLVGRALAGARRRRIRRTAAGAAAVLVLVAGVVTWELQRPAQRADVVQTPTSTPTPVPEPTSAPTVTPPLDANPATQPVWDPFTVVDAPRAPSPLPADVVPPAEPPSLSDEPLPDVVLAWPQEGEDLRVLSTDGQWRSVPGTARAIQGTFHDVVVPVISRAGDQIAMSTDAGVLVVEAATGDQKVLPWPPELAGPFDGRPRLLWLPDDEGVLVLHFEEPWLMGFDGSAKRAPYGGPYGSGVMVDPDTGTVRERRWEDRTLRTYDDSGGFSSVYLGGYGERFVTRFSQVAYVGNPGPVRRVAMSGPVVLDPSTGEVVAFAPIRDPDSVYSDNANLTPLGMLDETTVLLLVSPMDYRTMGVDDGETHLVTWDVVSGDFALVASGDSRMRAIAVAPDLVVD